MADPSGRNARRPPRSRMTGRPCSIAPATIAVAPGLADRRRGRPSDPQPATRSGPRDASAPSRLAAPVRIAAVREATRPPDAQPSPARVPERPPIAASRRRATGGRPPVPTPRRPAPSHGVRGLLAGQRSAGSRCCSGAGPRRSRRRRPPALAARARRDPAPIISGDALLPDHTDLLRELDPAHRARVHDHRRGHRRPASPPARRRHLVPDGCGRARGQGGARRRRSRGSRRGSTPTRSSPPGRRCRGGSTPPTTSSSARAMTATSSSSRSSSRASRRTAGRHLPGRLQRPVLRRLRSVQDRGGARRRQVPRPRHRARVARGAQLVLPPLRLPGRAPAHLRREPGVRAAGLPLQRGAQLHRGRAARLLDQPRDADLGGADPLGPDQVAYVWADALVNYLSALHYAPRRGPRALLAGATLPGQGHPPLPLRLLAGAAPRRRVRAAEAALRARLPEHRPPEDLEVARERDRPARPDRRLRGRRCPVLVRAPGLVRPGRRRDDRLLPRALRPRARATTSATSSRGRRR